MAAPATIGSGNAPLDRERIDAVERRLFTVIGHSRRPAFWPDAEVRHLMIVEHGFATLDLARSRAVERFGVDRAPSRSAIHRFWASLDAFWKMQK